VGEHASPGLVLSLEYPKGAKFRDFWSAVLLGRDGTEFEVAKHQAVECYSNAATAHPATRLPIDEQHDPLRHRQLARHTAMCRSGWIRSQPYSGKIITHQYADFQDCLPYQVYFSSQVTFRSISELMRLKTAPFADKDFNAVCSDCGT